ncbi:hypothetical protein BDZ91DRAFT_644177, partial [Kalaharituber pfeilii]
TLSLACLSLSTKSTEAPRRLRDILLPAYRLLHPPPQPPLMYPSHRYDALRHTLVQAELILLRALGFAIYLPLAYEFLPRFLSKVLSTHVYSGGQEGAECGVMELEKTGLGMRAREWVGRAARDYEVANFYTMRTVAVAAIWVGMREVGLGVSGDGS